MKLIYIFFAFLFFLASCSPAKRLERILKKHPELITKQSDTITQTIEFHHITKEIAKDTSFNLQPLKDSLNWLVDNIEIMLKKDNDNYNLNLNVTPDTTIHRIEREVITNNYYPPIIEEKGVKWSSIIPYILLFISIFLLLRK